jgi:hypothetical protein
LRAFIIGLLILVSGCSAIPERDKSGKIGYTPKVEPWNPFNTDKVDELARLVNSRVIYTKDLHNLWQAPKVTYTLGIGDCEDYAMLLVACLLHEGYDAYLVVNKNHAWVGYTSSQGEMFIDPTNYDLPHALATDKMWRPLLPVKCRIYFIDGDGYAVYD